MHEARGLTPGADLREVRLPVPGAGSFFLPALWRRTVAFLRSRTVARRRFPTELIEWTIGTNHLSKLPLPNNSYYAAEIKEQPEVRDTENAQGRITVLALNGTQVAYVRVAPWGEWTRSDLWVQKPAQRAKAIDWIGTGGGAAYGTRTYLSPTINGSWLYAYRQYHELGHAWVRYSLNTDRTQRAGIDLGDDSNGLVQAADPLDRGVVWSLQNQTEEGLPNAGARVLSLARSSVDDTQIPAVAGPLGGSPRATPWRQRHLSCGMDRRRASPSAPCACYFSGKIAATGGQSSL